MDRIDAMRLFLRVADAGSFSRAAADLSIGQPTVSRRIQDLEHQIGAELFHRTTRALNLTEAGQRFYDRAQDILSDFDEAEAEARGLDKEPVGMLRISAPHSFSKLVITPTIGGFLQKHPHIRIDLLTDDTYTDLVTEGVDIAFRLGELNDSALMAKRLMVAHRGIWAAPSYIEARGAPVTPDDLKEHDGLVFRQSLQGQQWTLKHEESGEEVRVNMDGRFRGSSGDTLLQGAIDGLGIFIGPSWLVCDHVRSGVLQRVMPDWRGSDLPLSVVWTGGKLRGKSRLFVDHVSEALVGINDIGR
ncbi:MAG: LysR substrate-binding domain-containing protein [Henriciella sp.]|nr:LysR substrate-binding domain-containing protein [Henriciella sp.]